jgi:cation transport ATPase
VKTIVQQDTADEATFDWSTDWRRPMREIDWMWFGGWAAAALIAFIMVPALINPPPGLDEFQRSEDALGTMILQLALTGLLFAQAMWQVLWRKSPKIALVVQAAVIALWFESRQDAKEQGFR